MQRGIELSFVPETGNGVTRTRTARKQITKVRCKPRIAIETVFHPVAHILPAIPHILTPVSNVLATVANAPVSLGVSNILSAIPHILPAIANIFTPVSEVFSLVSCQRWARLRHANRLALAVLTQQRKAESHHQTNAA